MAKKPGPAGKPGKAVTKSKSAPFPTRDQVAEFVRANPDQATKRGIARAFNISGDQRVELKILLKQLERDGVMYSKAAARAAALPAVSVIEVTHLDLDGEVMGKPVAWSRDEAPPPIYILSAGSKIPAVTMGDRVLARMERQGPYYIATPIRILDFEPEVVVGVFERTPTGGFIRPADKRDREEYRVARDDVGDAKTGEVVRAELLPRRGGGAGARQVRIVERLGMFGDAKSISLMAIAQHGIPHVFSEAALAQAKAAQPATLEEADGSGKGIQARTDLRPLPLVTIDGSDARDFDDAVFAEPDTDAENRGGWHLIVAIADVAHYVTPGSPLDREARDRGNSVYFPDRVVPMLPEELSNDLCSLRPQEDRACLAVHIWIDKDGRKLSHRFVRGLMRSAARLTYEQVQAAHDGQPDETTAPLLEPVIAPLYGAFAALLKAREERGTLDLDIPERRVFLTAEGAVAKVLPRDRLDSHKLIEEFMILANVCAAESLEQAKQPCMYRIHDQPSLEKLAGLREFLKSLDLSLAKGQVVMPRHFMQILHKVADTPNSHMVSEVVLRAQAQAAYSPDNIGHFGLALRRYAHFTSPIRRYADLLVHRALIRGLALPGQGGLDDISAADFAEIGTHISGTERRAALAEREVIDRYVAAFLADKVGAEFAGRISGVTRFGLFVKLDDTGADGLVPIRSLPDDYYHHDEHAHCLVGDRWGRIYRLAEPVSVRIVDVDIVTGGVVMALVEDDRPLTEGEEGTRRQPRLSARSARKPGSRSAETGGGGGKTRRANPSRKPKGLPKPKGSRRR